MEILLYGIIIISFASSLFTWIAVVTGRTDVALSRSIVPQAGALSTYRFTDRVVRSLVIIYIYTQGHCPLTGSQTGLSDP